MVDEGPTVTGGETAAGVSSKEHADKDLDVTVSAREAIARIPSKEHAGKGPNVTIAIGEAIADVPSQRHVVSPTIHDVHQSKEPPFMMSLSHLHLIKQVSCSIILSRMNAFCYCWRYNHASFCRVAERIFWCCHSENEPRRILGAIF